jgi:EpsI family protein
MPERNSPFDFLRNKAALAVALVLAVEIVLFYAIPTREYIPTPPRLDLFATKVGPWTMAQQFPLDDYTRQLLRADDTLTRDYAGPSNVELFIAFFKSQRAGVSPHSPKMCLPANGWTEESSRIISVNVPGQSGPIPVNRYIVSKPGQRKLVLYWFQSLHRATADEYLSKVYLILDAIRYRRSDEALVRVIADVTAGDAETNPEQHAIQFIQDLYQPLKQQIWSNPASAAVLP